MIKPILDNIDRQIMRADNSFYADRMKLFIATKKVERDFGKLLRLDDIVNWLSKKLK